MSNEPKWTPGPWVIDPEIRPMEVCTIHHLPDDERTDGQGWAYIRGALGRWDVDGDEAMANAHLIAAAPRIYSSLDELRRLFASGRGATDGDLDIDEREFERAILEAEEALAQARGES